MAGLAYQLPRECFANHCDSLLMIWYWGGGGGWAIKPDCFDQTVTKPCASPLRVTRPALCPLLFECPIPKFSKTGRLQVSRLFNQTLLKQSFQLFASTAVFVFFRSHSDTVLMISDSRRKCRDSSPEKRKHQGRLRSSLSFKIRVLHSEC